MAADDMTMAVVVMDAARLLDSPSQMGVMLHFRLRELQGGWTAKTIEFLSDDTVKFDNGAAHGRHSSVVNGIKVEFHCKADPLKMKYHSFDRMARTRLFMSSQKKARVDNLHHRVRTSSGAISTS